MTTTNPPASRERATLDALLTAIAEADAGDPVALSRVRKCFRAAPSLADHVSDLAYNAEAAILANAPAGAQEVVREQASQLRTRLMAEGTGTALERMLIRRIDLDYMATLQAERARSLAPGEWRSLELSRFYEQQADRTHRRFLAAVEALARVRKLITPIQINIAKQQLNVAGNLTAGKGDGSPPDPCDAL